MPDVLSGRPGGPQLRDPSLSGPRCHGQRMAASIRPWLFDQSALVHVCAVTLLEVGYSARNGSERKPLLRT